MWRCVKSWKVGVCQVFLCFLVVSWSVTWTASSQKYTENIHYTQMNNIIYFTLSYYTLQQVRRLLTGQSFAGEEWTVPHRELDFNIHPVGWSPLDEGRPEPVVSVVVGHITHHVRPPVDAVFKLSEALLDPLYQEGKKEKKSMVSCSQGSCGNSNSWGLLLWPK